MIQGLLPCALRRQPAPLLQLCRRNNMARCLAEWDRMECRWEFLQDKPCHRQGECNLLPTTPLQLDGLADSMGRANGWEGATLLKVTQYPTTAAGLEALRRQAKPTKTQGGKGSKTTSQDTKGSQWTIDNLSWVHPFMGTVTIQTRMPATTAC